MKLKRKDFDTTVADLSAKLKNMIEEPRYDGLKADEWLRALYDSYTSRFIHDNNLIWRTGSIMIPLSLAAFAAIPTIDCPRLVHLFMLGTASIVVFVSWLVLAENHRAFQDECRAWLVAIEHVIGIEANLSKVRGNRLNRLLTFSGAVQKMRWCTAVLVILGWALVWKFWPRCA